jgi:nicotinamidase-related amidase
MAKPVPVVYTLVTQDPTGAYASPVWLADNLRVGGGFEPRHCMEGTWGWQIADEVAPEPGDVLVRKLRRSAFEGTALETLLRGRGVTTVVATGGLAPILVAGCVRVEHHDPQLTLQGLRLIWERNQ